MKDSLTFKEYCKKTKKPISLIAYECGLSYHQAYRLLGKCQPTLKTAVAIQKYTNGEVTCESLLQKTVLKKIEKTLTERKKNESTGKRRSTRSSV